jgi:hypothetical protein
MNKINLSDIPLEALIEELQLRGLSPTFLSKSYEPSRLLKEENKAMLTTLGGRSRQFNFSIEDGNIIIDRIDAGIQDVLPIETLYSVIQKLNGSRFSLSNNVKLLKLGQEKEGFGTVLFAETGGNVTLAQSSSQLAAILKGCGLFTWNGLRRSMEFTILHMPSSAFELTKILIEFQKNLSKL